MKYLLLLAFSFTLSALRAQSVVFDAQHFASVIENQAVRSSAESTHAQYLSKINNNVQSVNTNAGSVVLAQTMIYNALANVNSALKDGLAVKNIGSITSDIIYYLDQAMQLARRDPVLLLVSSKIQNEMKPKALSLVSDVSTYVLKEGDNVLADYNARDELLQNVIRQLRIIDGMAYGAWRTMYWAGERGIVQTLNPWANYIYKDKTIVAQIIQNAKYLKQ